MTDDYKPTTLHLVVGSPWQDATFALLNARLQLWPWSDDVGARQGDGIVLVIDSDPQLLVAEVLLVPGDSEEYAAIIDTTGRPFYWAADSLGHSTVRVISSARIEGSDVGEIMDILDEIHCSYSAAACFGHTTMAAAQTLLRSYGHCTGCDAEFDMQTTAARDALWIRTVDQPEPLLDDARLAVDWPAVLCSSCQKRMVDGGFGNFLDYRFSRHPRCPQCGGKRTQTASFGMPVFRMDDLPWLDRRGCCVTTDVWTCGICSHQW